MNHQIKFEPIGLRATCPEGVSLLECARQMGVGLVTICGGQGKCKSCKVQILNGTVSEATSFERTVFSSEELNNGWRLACLTYPLSDCILHVPAESLTTLQRTQVESLEIAMEVDPEVKTVQVKLVGPTLNDLNSDASRLLEAVQRENVDCDYIDINILRTISSKLREWQWEARVTVRGKEIISISPISTPSLGLAVDVGTTKIAGYLIDLATGRNLASRGIINPQISYGEDITSRILWAMKSTENTLSLQNMVISAIDKLANELCSEIQAKPEEIVDACLVGNTAIHHLFLGLPVRQLAYSPFVAAVKEALNIKSRDMNLHLAQGAYAYILPNAAGFVGADHIAMLLAIDAAKMKKTTIAIDIGTNTEVSLIHDGEIYGASCASGPAFEGGHISHGMRAASGAIERLRLINGKINYQTVNNAPPVGICGSGVIDAVAQFYLAGMIDASGRINAEAPYSRKIENRMELAIVPEGTGQAAITLTQQDIRELQLAKAAIRTGIQILLETGGCKEEEIEQVIIAGAFGNYIDVTSAINVGMLPSIPQELFHHAGNAAGLGAKIALLSKSKRREAEGLADRLHYVELATSPKFTRIFSQSSQLGLFRIRNGRREELS